MLPPPLFGMMAEGKLETPRGFSLLPTRRRCFMGAQICSAGGGEAVCGGGEKSQKMFMYERDDMHLFPCCAIKKTDGGEDIAAVEIGPFLSLCTMYTDTGACPTSPL